ncbi:MAG: peptidase [Segniliparus sp.]|uniref:peptidase n=1 Tax=Segniliparus sp. TaxID=2804064 RepID=UPI003F3A142D
MEDPVEIAAFAAEGALRGFLVSGRWPENTKEWLRLLTIAVKMASVPGLLQTTTVFGAREERPEEAEVPNAVGLLVAEGSLLGNGALVPGSLAELRPPALLLLHPPSETTPSLPECEGAASGCLLLPGLPHLGLEHRAAWVEAGRDGSVTSIVSRTGERALDDPDAAVLAMLLAA